MRNKHKKITKVKFLPIIVAVLAVAGMSGYKADRVLAYSGNCTTQRCHEAADAEAAARAKEAKASQNRKDAETEIASKQASIEAKEASIVAKEAEVNDLAEQTKKLAEEIDSDQETLADIYAEIHFTETPSAINLLAGSGSLGDYSERQSRQDTVQERISATVKQLNNKKETLQKKKDDQQQILDGLQNEYAELAAQKADLEATAERYKNDAAAYAKDAEKASEIRAQEEAAQLAAQQSNSETYDTGTTTSTTPGSTDPGNTYPWRGICPDSNLAFLTTWGYVCQCTSYAGYKASEHWGVKFSSWGNAYSWGYSASRAGYRVDSTPAPFTVAVSTAGEYGHVMWVESVNPNGTINISEYNNYYSAASHRMGDYGTRTGVGTAGLQFIHFN